MANLLWLVPSRIRYATASRILVFRYYTTCPRDRTYRHFPSDSIFYHLFSVDSPDPLTGHSYLLHTLHDFVGTSGLTFVQNVPLPSTNLSNHLSSSVCNLMRRRPIHLLPLASSARRFPLIYPANRLRSDGRPRRIRCYKYVPLIVVFGVGTQLPRRPLMTRRRNAEAGGGCYLFSSKFVCVKVG